MPHRFVTIPVVAHFLDLFPRSIAASGRLCLRLCSGLTVAAALAFVAESAWGEDHDRARDRLLEEIQRDAVDTGRWTGRPGFSSETMAAMRRVPRHRFVPERLVANAYENRPLPIGYGQTISQPYIVALMTDLLDLSSDDRVLEVGTGSGYQAAVAAVIAEHVHTVEIIKALSDQARDRLRRAGIRNVTLRWADGYHGWPEQAPFDAIIVTAAADHIPPPLVRQLKPGGRMVIPVGPRFLTQRLVLIEKAHGGQVTTRQLLPVRFVPLTRRP